METSKFVSGGGAWPRLTVPLFRPSLAFSLAVVDHRSAQADAAAGGGFIADGDCRERRGRGQVAARLSGARVALEVFGNYELPHIHAAVEELTEGVGAGQRYATRA